MDKKIKHIDIGDTEWELNDMLEKYKPEVMAKVLDKMVEIIDRLNQSQKQPEEEYKGSSYLPESEKQPEGWLEDMRKESMADLDKLTIRPEKQEEWRERFYKEFVGSKATNPRELKGDTIWESTEYTTGSPKEIVEFISQLLSERTREAKQEAIEDFISELECWKVAWIDRTKNNGAEYLRDGLLKMLNKDLSKLLKKKNNESRILL